MAFLMLLHEKMRLQRKQTKLTLKQLRNGNMLSRMESKVKKREKYYSKLEKQIERQAQAYKNYATNNINSIFGGFDPSGIYSGQIGIGGCNNLQQQAITQAVAYYKNAFTADQLVDFMQNSYGYSPKETYDSKTEMKDRKFVNSSTSEELTGTQYQALQQAVRYVQQCQSNMQQQVQAWKTQYTEQVDQWAEIMKEQLDGQKEYEMDLLAEEQTEYEAEKEGIAAELELVKQRKEAIEQELGQSIKDAAPKFGLA